MKPFLIHTIYLFLIFTLGFGNINEKSIKLSPFLGYVNFHQEINLKDNIIAGLEINKPLVKNLNISFSGGFIPSKYSSNNQNVSVFYGSTNGQYFLPTIFGVNPFLSSGISLFGFNENIDKAIEVGIGLLAVSDKGLEHKFELKNRYNPGNKKSDIIIMIYLDLFNEPRQPTPPKKPVKQEVKVTTEPTVTENIVKEERMPTEEIKTDIIATTLNIEEKEEEIIEKEITREPQKIFVDDTKIVIDRFYFNSKVIGNPGKTLLQKTVDLLKDEPELKIIVTGFANKDEEDYNSLSLERANSATNILMNEHKISNDRITIKAGGDSPVSSYDYLNRRVEIDFYFED